MIKRDCGEEELALLKVAEQSFNEWENEEDQVYDTLNSDAVSIP